MGDNNVWQYGLIAKKDWEMASAVIKCYSLTLIIRCTLPERAKKVSLDSKYVVVIEMEIGLRILGLATVTSLFSWMTSGNKSPAFSRAFIINVTHFLFLAAPPNRSQARPLVSSLTDKLMVLKISY